jgi:signal transduction histidine kinase/Tfp pilus assembly protein PilF
MQSERKLIIFLLLSFLTLTTGVFGLEEDKSSLTNLNNNAEELVVSSPNESIKLLKEVLDKSTDAKQAPERARALKLMGIVHYYQQNYRQSHEYFEQALQLYRKLNDQDGIASILNNTGLIYERQGDFSGALKRYNEAAGIMSNLPESKEKLTNTLSNIGNVYYTLGRLDKALDFLTQALNNSSSISDSSGMAKCYNNIGNIYLSLNDFNTAADLFSKAEKIRLQENNTEKLPLIYNNLGEAYLGLNKIDEALNYNRLSLQMASKINDTESIISSLLNISEIYIRLKDYDQALINYNEALRLSSVKPDRFLHASVLDGLGDLKIKQGDYDEAIAYFKDALSLVEKTGSDLLLQEIYTGLSDAYEAKGNYQKAFQYLRMHEDLIDSVYNKENLDRLNLLRVSFELEQTERDNQLLRQQNIYSQLALSRQQIIRNLFIVITAIVLVSLAFLSLLYYSKKRKNELLILSNDQISKQKEELDKLYIEQYKLNETKNKFFSIVAHDLKSPFQSLLGFTELLSHEYDHFNDEQRLDAIKNMYKVTSDTYKLIENLLEWGRIQTGNATVSMKNLNLNEFVNSILPIFQIPLNNKNLTLTLDVPPLIMASADPNMLGAVIRNLLSNAIKFSEPGGIIHIKGITTSDSSKLAVTDNGIGISPEVIDKLFTFDPKVRRNGTKGETGTGMGLGLCMEFMQLNHGMIKVNSKPGEGSTFTVILQPGSKSLVPEPAKVIS